MDEIRDNGISNNVRKTLEAYERRGLRHDRRNHDGHVRMHLGAQRAAGTVGPRPALHHPKALLVPARQAPGGPAAGVFDFDEFVASRARVPRRDRLLRSRDRRAGVPFWGDRARVSAYEARTAPAPAGKVLRRGVNSIQLMHDGARWWILSTIWDNEREGVTLPPELV